MEWIVGLIVGILIGGVACWIIQESRSRSRLTKQDADHRETVAGLEGQLAQTYSAHQIVEDAKRQLSDAFQATASRALETTNQRLLDIADSKLDKTLETAKGEFKQRHEQFQALVKPLADDYHKLNPQIESFITSNQKLASETGKLSEMLTNNRKVGEWGEMTLRRVVELANMTRYCDFDEQRVISENGGRPDLIVRLPQERKVIVDSKASLEAFGDAQRAQDERGRKEALGRHAKALRTQINELAKKNYGANERGSLDFVVMFIPGDQFLAAALEGESSNGTSDSNLISYAMSKRVAIATPSSLIALLWTVANGWEQHRLSEDAQKIREAGEKMHQRIQKFIEHYLKVGKRLESVVKAYNASVGSYDENLQPQGRKFTELRTGKEDDFPVSPSRIETSVKTSRHVKELESGS